MPADRHPAFQCIRGGGDSPVDVRFIAVGHRGQQFTVGWIMRGEILSRFGGGPLPSDEMIKRVAPFLQPLPGHVRAFRGWSIVQCFKKVSDFHFHDQSFPGVC